MIPVLLLLMLCFQVQVYRSPTRDIRTNPVDAGLLGFPIQVYKIKRFVIVGAYRLAWKIKSYKTPPPNLKGLNLRWNQFCFRKGKTISITTPWILSRKMAYALVAMGVVAGLALALQGHPWLSMMPFPVVFGTAWIDGNTAASAKFTDMDGAATPYVNGDTVNLATHNLEIDANATTGTITVTAGTFTLDVSKTILLGGNLQVDGASVISGVIDPVTYSVVFNGTVAINRGGLIGLSHTWTRTGTVMSATEVWEQNNIYEPTVMYDDNPQILAGPNVFKMWYSGGWAGPGGTGYAESADGINWTKYGSNPVIAGENRNTVIKVGSTYHMYLSGHYTGLAHYTSTDGLAWTLIGEAVPVGGAGTWDSGVLCNCHVYIESGTWYMLYEAIPTSGATWRIGLATSSDGTTWTKYAGNPVIGDGVRARGGAASVQKIGSVYYMWCHGAPEYGTGLPSDGFRYSSTDFHTWIPATAWPIMPRQTADEGQGLAAGQLADMHLISQGGTIYNYYVASTDGASAAGLMHIKLATYAGTFTQLVATKEDGAGTAYSISFSKALTLQTRDATYEPGGFSAPSSGGTLLYTSAAGVSISHTMGVDCYSYHNFGTATVTPGNDAEIVFRYGWNFYNFTTTGGTAHAYVELQNGIFTIEGAGSITSYLSLTYNVSDLKIIIGSTTAAGSLTNNGIIQGRYNGHAIYIEGASASYPAVVTGTDLHWDANAPSIFNLKWLDYQINAVTGGGHCTVNIIGNTSLRDWTTTAGDFLTTSASVQITIPAAKTFTNAGTFTMGANTVISGGSATTTVLANTGTWTWASCSLGLVDVRFDVTTGANAIIWTASVGIDGWLVSVGGSTTCTVAGTQIVGNIAKLLENYGTLTLMGAAGNNIVIGQTTRVEGLALIAGSTTNLQYVTVNGQAYGVCWGYGGTSAITATLDNLTITATVGNAWVAVSTPIATVTNSSFSGGDDSTWEKTDIGLYIGCRLQTSGCTYTTVGMDHTSGWLFSITSGNATVIGILASSETPSAGYRAANITGNLAVNQADRYASSFNTSYTLGANLPTTGDITIAASSTLNTGAYNVQVKAGKSCTATGSFVFGNGGIITGDAYSTCALKGAGTITWNNCTVTNIDVQITPLATPGTAVTVSFVSSRFTAMTVTATDIVTASNATVYAQSTIAVQATAELRINAGAVLQGAGAITNAGTLTVNGVLKMAAGINVNTTGSHTGTIAGSGSLQSAGNTSMWFATIADGADIMVGNGVTLVYDAAAGGLRVSTVPPRLSRGIQSTSYIQLNSYYGPPYQGPWGIQK